jgi:hypothetical protein
VTEVFVSWTPDRKKKEADALMSKDFDSATLIAAWVRK